MALEWMIGLRSRYDLDVEFEFDDVAVLHDVSFALGAELAGLLDGELGAEGFEVVVPFGWNQKSRSTAPSMPPMLPRSEHCQNS